jgi:molybdopterin converting factor small subunit
MRDSLVKVTIEYNSYRLRKIAGVQREALECTSEITVQSAIEALEKRHGEAFGRSVLSADDKSLLVTLLVNGVSVRDLDHMLADGDALNFIILSTAG